MGGNFSYHLDLVADVYNWYYYRNITPGTSQYDNQILAIASDIQNRLLAGDANGFKSYLKYFEPVLRKRIVCLKIDNRDCVEIACSKSDFRIIAFILEQCGVDPNVRLTSLNETPLHVADKGDNLEAAKCLVDHGADVNLVTGSGQSCLDLSLGNADMCKLLISNGVDINTWKTHGGDPIIFTACENGDKDLVNFLVKHNTNMDVRNKKGQNPIYVAAYQSLCKKLNFHRHDLDVIDVLLQISEIPDSEKVQALEIIGCERVKRYILPTRLGPFAFLCLSAAKEYWAKALTLKLKNQDGEKNEHPCLGDGDSKIMCDIWRCRSPNDLDKIFADREEDKTKILIEAAIITETILGIDDAQTILFFKHLSSRYIRSVESPNDGIIFRVFDPFLKHVLANSNKVTGAWIENFQFILINWVFFHEKVDKEEYTITFEIMLWFIDKLQSLQQKDIPVSRDNLSSIFVVLIYVCGWTCEDKTKSCLRVVVQKLKDLGCTEILNYCVSAYFGWMGQQKFEYKCINCVKLVKLLLQNGMSADETDKGGDTPLAYCIKRYGYSLPIHYRELLDNLVEHSHLDMVLNQKYSVLSLMQEIGYTMPPAVSPLQCVAANVIAKHRVSYRHNVPSRIAVFIDMHLILHREEQTGEIT